MQRGGLKLVSLCSFPHPKFWKLCTSSQVFKLIYKIFPRYKCFQKVKFLEYYKYVNTDIFFFPRSKIALLNDSRVTHTLCGFDIHLPHFLDGWISSFSHEESVPWYFCSTPFNPWCQMFYVWKSIDHRVGISATKICTKVFIFLVY